MVRYYVMLRKAGIAVVQFTVVSVHTRKASAEAAQRRIVSQRNLEDTHNTLVVVRLERDPELAPGSVYDAAAPMPVGQ